MSKPQSRLVLGGSSLSRLTPAQLEELLSVSYSLGIREIDAAPSYGNLESTLGLVLPNDTNWRINSKVSNPDHTSLPACGLESQVLSSLKKLKKSHLETLFVHSIPMRNLKESELQSLSRLKLDNIVNHIGFSSNADPIDLELAVHSGIFDSYQITANILDQTNLKLVSALTHSHIYFKRILGSGVLKTGILEDLKLQVKILLHLSERYNKNDYLFRFNSMFGFYKRKSNYVDTFLNFVFSLGSEQRVIIGVSNPNHLREVARLENEISSDFDFSESIRIFGQLEGINNWKPFR